MNIYLNPGNENFKRTLAADIYVDKTMMIDVTNKFIEKGNTYICISRPRRFGKTIAGNMLAAYYSKGCNSAELFSQYKIADTDGYTKHLNKYNVIQIDMNSEYQNRPIETNDIYKSNKKSFIKTLVEDICEELRAEHSDIKFKEDDSLAQIMLKVYKTKGETFVILIDEYDVLIREQAKQELLDEYLSLLNGLFKSSTLQPAISLAYLTGILPIIRDKVQSKLNNFKEYTFLDAGVLSEYVGFTSEEVRALCEENKLNYEECRRWYDGYRQNEHEIYSPESVVQCLINKKFGSYWGKTSSYEVISDRIRQNFEGIKDAVIGLLSGEEVDVNATRFLNTMTSFKTKDDLLTYLIHAGYLAYDQGDNTCHIPNKEVRQEWFNALESDTEDEYAVTNRIIQDSKKLLTSTWKGDGEAVAKALDTSHIHVTSNRNYNNEDVLQSAICLAYIYANNRYTIIKEMTTGKGFADVVFIPFLEDDPAMIIELKRNGSAESAIKQIKEKKYFDSLRLYNGRLLFVGIDYDSKTKNHTCIIESFAKQDHPNNESEVLYDLLIKIDDGYQAIGYEKRLLKSATNINWKNIEILPKCIGLLAGITNLDLSFSNVSDISALSKLKSLTNLGLRGTKISDISALSKLKSLTSLDLSRTKVSDISALRELKALNYLNLSYLSLNTIPEWLLDLELDFLQGDRFVTQGIIITELVLKDQPIEIFSQSRKLIRTYYKSLEKAPINECKVVFLGDGGAGKSLIIDRLMRQGELSPIYNDVSTPGIRISSKEYQIKGDKIELHFWDFGGQAIMHSMHRLFLTNRTLYVVVTNARDNKANEQAWYWIRNIKSLANGAPVLLLVNQKDQNPSANINETGLRKEYPQIKGVSIVSAKEDTTEEFNKLIRDEICRIVSEMDSVHTLVPQSWHSLMNDLQEMDTDYIDLEKFYEKCRDNGVDVRQDTINQIISWYQDLGVCFYSRKNPVARRSIVLKPKWLLNALYILPFNGRKYSKNGIISEDDIYKLFCEPVSAKDIKKAWPDINYKPNEIQYIISVLINYDLVYRIDNGRFFIPMLCDENEPKVVDNFETEDAIHVSFKYEYLPENVLHRLMVLHGFELNRDLVWKTGAVLERKRLGWQALARSKDDCLDVYAKASDQKTHPINSYLDIIRESVYRINSDFGLAAEEYITYAKDGKTDEFEYQWLEESKNAGLNEVYSRVFKTRIRIDEIIGIIKSPNLLQSNIDYIYECVMSACKQIQARKIYWNKPDHIVSEDDRNDGMRDLISSRGVFVRDQTHAGRGQEGKNPGEVDLMIMNSLTDAQALIETMVLSGVNTQYIKKHLNKLVDGYNDSGFRDLFLVSYVELERSKFPSFWERYKKKVKELGTGNFTVNTKVAPEEDDSSAWIKSIKITYDCAGEDIRVYHICARVAE